MTVHWSDTQAEKAKNSGRAVLDQEPRAVAARYDGRSKKIIVDLTNGATFAFPAALVEGLAEASTQELADVEILGVGLGLHWESLDVDYTVRGLLNGVFGTSRWMASKAGSTTSAAKAAAARENGLKGGRPRKAG